MLEGTNCVYTEDSLESAPAFSVLLCILFCLKKNNPMSLIRLYKDVFEFVLFLSGMDYESSKNVESFMDLKTSQGI